MWCSECLPKRMFKLLNFWTFRVQIENLRQKCEPIYWLPSARNYKYCTKMKSNLHWYNLYDVRSNDLNNKIENSHDLHLHMNIIYFLFHRTFLRFLQRWTGTLLISKSGHRPQKLTRPRQLDTRHIIQLLDQIHIIQPYIHVCMFFCKFEFMCKLSLAFL